MQSNKQVSLTRYNNIQIRTIMANLILASKREVKSGSQMWHVYRLSENTKSDEFFFALPIKALRYAFLLRKRTGAILPKAIYTKLMADVSASKAQAEPSAAQESAPEAEQEAPTAQAVGEVEPSQAESAEVEQAKFFKQFTEMKRKHPEAVLLFRVKGDYVTFGDDCEVVKAVCGVSSFPHTALDNNLPLLVRAGKRVAICDDITTPSAPKKKAARKSAKSESK